MAGFGAAAGLSAATAPVMAARRARPSAMARSDKDESCTKVARLQGLYDAEMRRLALSRRK
jgi:hypothetical protein